MFFRSAALRYTLAVSLSLVELVRFTVYRSAGGQLDLQSASNLTNLQGVSSRILILSFNKSFDSRGMYLKLITLPSTSQMINLTTSSFPDFLFTESQRRTKAMNTYRPPRR